MEFLYVAGDRINLERTPNLIEVNYRDIYSTRQRENVNVDWACYIPKHDIEKTIFFHSKVSFDYDLDHTHHHISCNVLCMVFFCVYFFYYNYYSQFDYCFSMLLLLLLISFNLEFAVLNHEFLDFFLSYIFHGKMCIKRAHMQMLRISYLNRVITSIYIIKYT